MNLLRLDKTRYDMELLTPPPTHTEWLALFLRAGCCDATSFTLSLNFTSFCRVVPTDGELELGPGAYSIKAACFGEGFAASRAIGA